ncbi:MAG: Uma2 family endonuclease [Chloroflexia bacterium]|nr:Uma2 family endonuclease [Chloroflexia bacterium]
MATTTRLLTAADVWALPEDERGELVQGELRPMPPVDLDHVDLVGTLIEHLRRWTRVHAPGVVGPEGGFLLEGNPDTLLSPDIAYIREERLPPKGSRQGFARMAPDLVVEVLSPSNTAREMETKVRLYLDAGVRLVWVFDQGRRVVVVHPQGHPPRELHAGDTLDGGDVLPGFALPLAELFN